SWTPPLTASFELRVRVADVAGNTFTSPTVTVSYAGLSRDVALADPGSLLNGTATLNATVGTAVARTVFEASPTGTAQWSTLATATSSPWSASADTTKLADGLYDLRAGGFDSTGALIKYAERDK